MTVQAGDASLITDRQKRLIWQVAKEKGLSAEEVEGTAHQLWKWPGTGSEPAIGESTDRGVTEHMTATIEDLNIECPTLNGIPNPSAELTAILCALWSWQL